MEFDWDPAKDEINREKHGYSLQDGEDALKANPDFSRDFEDGRFTTIVSGTDGEHLFIAGETNTSLDVTRIISVRKAEKDELSKYWTE